ncbi:MULTISPECIES: CheF family chemotaxis protein [unclassified Halorhabdus]|uniref:CheF family chemotaxis protein n=1 Tax=unclassified Halorhabdus TaxID=2621901 RepID=UPI0023DCD9C3|nr:MULTISPECIES: CheF family chemotaxis protein [unclassified Halorhabdus]WEL16867.1 Chemotaxis protein CheF [Halorhabdus sp. SVX81]WEL20741.1 Chemotaxis protein CheF [Halorhabdus sp. BNX81]
MSESVIADFVASFNSERSARSEPVKGRVLLSQKRLVLAADESKTTIPLSSIFDVAVGHVPPDLGDFFDSTVTIAFEKSDSRFVAVVEADDETIEKFSTVLFKALLNGTDSTVQHPAEIGGRVTDAEYVPAKLFLQPKGVQFKRQNDSFTVTLAQVTKFERSTREIAGSERAVLAVRHMPDGEAITTVAAMPSARMLSLLGRYLRLEYSDLMGELKDIELSDPEIELLVAVYSTGDMEGIPLANVLDREASEVTMLVTDLEEKQLLTTGDAGPALTSKGRVVVNRHLEDVNE